MRFKARFDLTPVAGRLIYVPHDYAVQFRPKSTAEFRHRSGDLGRYTLGVDTLQLEVGIETGQLVSLWGLMPRPGWTLVRLKQPHASPGGLQVDMGKPVDSGDYAIPGAQAWKRRFDEATGWLRIGPDSTVRSDYVEFLEGVVAGIRAEELIELWLHPDFSDAHLPSTRKDVAKAP